MQRQIRANEGGPQITSTIGEGWAKSINWTFRAIVS